ncbi:DUF2523 family protein [Kingella potus]|uniref:DUF2523 family protein n=1 Tax=Kingella potus TaxID=265175 RepID=UPI000E1C26E8|nr:DUF2523 family protein [Kingella potus]UOP01746.1 DUF2523 domain-containing protein [Kingella potus]
MALPLIPAIGALLAGIFIKKLILSFGFAAVTYVGFDYFFDILKRYFYEGYYSLPLDLIILLDIGGFKQGIGILFGCINFKVASMILTRLESNLT